MAAGSNAQDVMLPVTQTIAEILNYSTQGASSGIKVGIVPANSVILNWHVRVLTAFNAGTTNPITIGTTATGAEVMAAAAITDYNTASNAVGYYFGAPVTSTGWAQFSTDQTIYASYIPTGTAATTGKAVIVVEYISLAANDVVL